MPGINCIYMESLTEEGLDLDKLFGVFKAKIKTNNKYLGLLPIKTKEGLIFPNGEFEGIWPSPELIFAKKNGYDVHISEGYNFSKIPSYFKDYIMDLYTKKSSTTGIEKKINKSLLNNLLGRFGLNIIKPITKIVKNKELDRILSTRLVKSIDSISSDVFLVNYMPLIDKNICDEHGIHYLKALDEEKKKSNIDKNIDVFEDVSVIISAIVTSYARVYMLNILMEILKSGGNIYYMDTDSIVTDISIETLSSDLIGKELGQFKKEYGNIKEGFFISNKTYCLVLEDNSTVIKCKGVINKSLTLENFKEMYYFSKNVCANKTVSKTFLSKGFVNIEDSSVILQHDSYKKRQKLFNEKNLWVNTSALLYNNMEKSISTIQNSADK